MLFQNNDLRFFQNAEIFDGYKRIEIIKDTQRILNIMENLNQWYRDRKRGKHPNFKFITNPNTNKFSLSLIERILMKDKNNKRYERLKQRSLILFVGNCIGYNLNLESVVQGRLMHDDYPDYPTVNLMINQMLMYDFYF